MASLGRIGIPFIYNDLHLPGDEIDQFRKHHLLSEFYIDWVGQFDRVFDNHTYDRVLNEHLIVYCYDGEGLLKVQGQSYRILPGLLFFLAAGTKHTYGNIEGGYWSGYWVHSSGSASDTLIRSCFGHDVEILNIGNHAKLQSLFEDMLACLRVGHSLDDALHAANALRYMLTYIHLQRRSPLQDAPQEPRISEILAFMGSNTRTSLTLEQMAARAHLSKYQFVRCFKKHTGFPPMQYFTMLRIKQACSLLMQRDMNVQEISAFMGFENPYYFSTVFKRTIGCAPSRFVSWDSVREE